MLDNENIIKIYKKLYDLPTLSHTEKVSFDFFRSCKKNHRFITLAIYNRKRELLLLRDFNKNIGWELVGGYLEKNERIEDGVNRVVSRETSLLIDELQPIVLINNNFKWDKKIISHFGIGFTALVRGRVKEPPEHIKVIYTREIPGKMAYQNRKVAEKAIQKIRDKIHEIPYEEIESAKRFFSAHCVNKYIVKPLIGRLASKRINKKILQLICNNPKSIIDVSCGDDQLIFKLEKLYKPEICIGNDISWKTISLLSRTHKKNSNVLFTNHNALELPFKKKFDLIIFKNTLHHIPDGQKINLIKTLSSLAKQLIIVDIDNPSRSTYLAKIWNWYYVHFLGDQGDFFLTYREFKKILSENIQNKKIACGIINTIKGRYFYASLIDMPSGKEVELKVKIEPFEVIPIRKKLFAFGMLGEKRIRETDVYFNSPFRDFIKTRECLRVREKSDGYLELTYKGRTTNSMKKKKQFWKSEINIPLFNSSKKDMETFLISLGFKKIVEVVKEREKFILKKQTVTLDKVKNIGWFLEIENIARNKSEEKEALNKNTAFLKKLGLSTKTLVEEPYRDLVLKGMRENIK